MSWQSTIGEIIRRYIGEMDGAGGVAGIKKLGESHRCTLLVIAGLPIGSKVAVDLKKSDVFEMCKTLRQTRAASTVNQYFTYLSGALKHAGSAWEDCETVTTSALINAKPQLKKLGIIGKSAARKRRPTNEELHQLLTLFAEQNKSDRTEIDMVQIIAFALVSTRRLGEICRITHGDLAWDHKDKEGRHAPIYTVRDIKHPTKKKGNDKSFPLIPELIEIIKRQPRLRPDDPSERVFPYNPHSASARYTEGKKKLGILGLRFHDNRREATSRWLKHYTTDQVRRYFTGHDTNQVLEHHYDGREATDFYSEITDIPPTTPTQESRAA